MHFTREWAQEQVLKELRRRGSPTWVVPGWAVQEADPGPESILQGKIEKWCRDWGRPCLSFRQSKHAKRLLPAGWPDMEIIMPKGQTLRIELKSRSGRLSAEQKQLRLQFMALGHTIHQIRSYRAFLSIVERFSRAGNP